MKNGTILFSLLLVLSSVLAGCGEDPAASDFAAPQLGAVTVEAEAFRVRIACPVSGNLDGVSG